MGFNRGASQVIALSDGYSQSGQGGEFGLRFDALGAQDRSDLVGEFQLCRHEVLSNVSCNFKLTIDGIFD
jgi:hypothetical protein